MYQIKRKLWISNSKAEIVFESETWLEANKKLKEFKKLEDDVYSDMFLYKHFISFKK